MFKGDAKRINDIKTYAALGFDQEEIIEILGLSTKTFNSKQNQEAYHEGHKVFHTTPRLSIRKKIHLIQNKIDSGIELTHEEYDLMKYEDLKTERAPSRRSRERIHAERAKQEKIKTEEMLKAQQSGDSESLWTIAGMQPIDL